MNGKVRFVLKNRSPSFRPRLGASDSVTVEMRALLKGDPGIEGLSYVVITDSEGVPLATLLTGTIQ